jgi:hypothetical protein
MATQHVVFKAMTGNSPPVPQGVKPTSKSFAMWGHKAHSESIGSKATGVSD